LQYKIPATSLKHPTT